MIIIGFFLFLLGLFSLCVNIFFIIKNRYNKKTFEKYLREDKDYQRHCKNIDKYFNS